MAQIHTFGHQYSLATQSLEMGLSYNFKVRDYPLYHIIKAQSLRMQGSFTEALSSLKIVMGLPGIKIAVENLDEELKPTLSERVTVFLEVVKVESKLKNLDGAARMMQETMKTFTGTSEEGRIVIANAGLLLYYVNQVDLSIERGEIDVALQILSGISQNYMAEYFMDAKIRMADIYKTYKNDNTAYANCYKDIAAKNHGLKSLLLLGDAYLKIDEPEKAVAVYERALKENPKATFLAKNIGISLVKTYQYKKAVNYYEQALKGENIDPSLRFDLASLYLILDKHDDAERVVNAALDHVKSEESLILAQDVKLYIMRAKIYKATNDIDGAINTLSKAKNIHLQLVYLVLIPSIMARDPSDNQESKKIVSEILILLAEIYQTSRNDPDLAISSYNEAIQHHPSCSTAMLALVKIHLSRSDLPSAQTLCTKMIRMDVKVDEATLLLANIMYRNNMFDAAIVHYKDLLQRAPSNYDALSQLLDMLRRNGTLDQAKSFFEIVEGHDICKQHAGYHYCKGLLYSFNNNLNAALDEFNRCRRDGKWGESTVFHMIEIFLNPENETIGI
jgi:tetratricopeptide (TPR) repeat protein